MVVACAMTSADPNRVSRSQGPRQSRQAPGLDNRQKNHSKWTKQQMLRTSFPSGTCPKNADGRPLISDKFRKL